MRRILLIVAILLIATPAFATVSVNAVYKGSNVVEVNYACTNSEHVRAFGLNIEVNGGVTFDAVNDFNVGDNNGYGIFPGKFRDYINAASPTWTDPCYIPIAPPGDPGAKPGLGTGAVTVEMGSLYTGSAPPAAGRLCTLTLNSHGAVFGDVNVTVNTNRGGVVLEDGSTIAATLSTGKRAQFIFAPSAPAWMKYAAYDPDCNVPVWWAATATATGYQLERSSKAAPAYAIVKSGVPADFNCESLDCNWGDMKLAVDQNYHWRVLARNVAGDSAYTTLNYDCNVINSLCFPATGTTAGSYAQWRNVGKPDCWCKAQGANIGPRGAGYQCDGDTAGDDSGPSDYFRVYLTDMTVLSNNWKKDRPAITSDPNTTGGSTGTLHKMAACADIDHADSGPSDYFRVYLGDLTILSNNWKKHNSSWTGTDKLLGNCPR